MKALIFFLAPMVALGQVHLEKVATDEAILLQIIETSKKLQTELDQTKKDKDSVAEELATAKQSHQDALSNSNKLQLEIKDITDWGNQQAAAKDLALTERDHEKKRGDEILSKYHKVKLILCVAAAALATMIMMKFTSLLTFLGPYVALAPFAVGGIVSITLWMLL